MIKIVIKLAIAALVIHACWRSANVYLRYYNFKDAAHEMLLFSQTKPDGQLEAKAMELAQQFEVPVQPENITVRHVSNRTVLHAVYTDQIEIVPSKFYPWEFKVDVEVINVNMPAATDVTAPGR